MFAFLVSSGPSAQKAGSEGFRPTGLIPLDERQIQRIVENWPRITRVNVNRVGLERINAVRAAKGKPLIDAQTVRPVGRELESRIIGRVASLESAVVNNESLEDLPTAVDNSELPYFPPIRDQSPLGSCAAFATTYTQLSYMNAFQRGLDIRNDSDNTNKFSPKWTYNMVNRGRDSGATFADVYALLEGHGAATWAEFPYDADCRAWCLDPLVWRRALDVRMNPAQYVDPACGRRELIKQLLTDGYVLVFGTYYMSLVSRAIQDDPTTSDDDAEVGQRIISWLNGASGPHAMVVVGYNDAIWTDINEDGRIDPGEKGAYRVANSWGPEWTDRGFIWLAYDALYSNSQVPYGPWEHRVQAFQGDMCFLSTVRDDASPLMVAEFTVNHAKREQLQLTLGRSGTEATVPSAIWTPGAFQEQGGTYGFDGSTTAVDGTFVLDVSDLLADAAGLQRYYLGMHDNEYGDPATLKAFKIVDLTTDPPTEAVSSLVPQFADHDQQVYAYVDYAYNGPAYNHPPRLQDPPSPAEGDISTNFTYSVRYYDEDGDVPSVAYVCIDGIPQAMEFRDGSSPSDGRYQYMTTLPVGRHDYYFRFEDGRGGSARLPILGVYAGPEVTTFRFSSMEPNIATVGDADFILTLRGLCFMEGAVVRWDGSDRPTTYVDNTRLEAAISAGDLDHGKFVEVRVHNPDGGYSNAARFLVYNPKPIVSSLDPPRISGGGTGFTLRVLGSNFFPDTVVEWDGRYRAPEYVGGAEIRVPARAEDIATGGAHTVAVINPTPAGGGLSTSFSYTVTDFTVGVGLSANNIAPGQSVRVTVRVQPRFGSFDAPVSLTLSGLPTGCPAILSPSVVTPGNSVATATLTIETKAPGQSGAGALSGPPGLGPPAAGLLALVLALFGRLLGVGWFSQGSGRRRLAAAVLVCLMIGLSACSVGGGGEKGTTPGTYVIIAQGGSGGLVATAQASLTIR